MKQQTKVLEKFKPGDVCTIIANHAGHKFEIGEQVVIFRNCVDGYKAIQGGTIPEDPEQQAEKWWYVDYEDVKLYA